MEILFNPDHLKDESLKRIYKYLLIRGNEIIGSFKNAYPSINSKPEVTVNYLLDKELNAFVQWNSDEFSIRIHSPTIYLLRNLFDELFTFDQILPEIKGKEFFEKPEQNILFLPDPNNIDKRVTSQILLDKDRSLASTVITDICATFILLHEIGHIVCGHVNGANFYFKENTSPKFIDLFAFKHRGAYLRRSMEYDADLVAGILIVQYIEQLEENILKGGRIAEVFDSLKESGNLYEKLLALIILSFYAFFTYLSGRTPYRFDRRSPYPHPLVRAFYIRDVIIQTAEDRRIVNTQLILKLCQKYFDQFDPALYKLGLIQPNQIIKDVMMNLDHHTKEIQNYANRFRKFTKKWSWVPLDEWN